MLDRLKTLPLTILLTILVWMYAEAQFTSTQPEVPITVRIASGSQDYAVRVLDPVNNRYTNQLNLTVTLQGPKNQVDQIYQESQGMRDNAGGDKLAALTFIPTSEQLRAAGAAGGKLTPNVLQMLNNMDYFRSRGVTVTIASPASATVDVVQVTRVHKPVLFQDPLVASATLNPSEVDVQVPTDMLPSLGAGKLRVRAEPENESELASLPPNTTKDITVRFVAEYDGPRDERIRVLLTQGTATVKTRGTP